MERIRTVFLVACILGCMLLLVPGVSASDMMFHYDATHSGNYTPVAGTTGTAVSQLWNYTTGNGGGSTPAVDVGRSQGEGCLLCTPSVGGDPTSAECVSHLYGVCFSPYLDGQSPETTSYIPPEQIRKRLAIVAPYTDWIRTFGCTNGLENIGQIAHEFGLKAAIGAWIGSDTAANNREIDNLINVSRAGYADIAVVGNEALYSQTLSEGELISIMNRVRENITAGNGPTIPVTTAEPWGVWLAHPALIDAADVVLINIYPFHENIPIDGAVQFTDEHYKSVQSAAGNKPVMISEMGWPSAGSAKGLAVPSLENASSYFINATRSADTISIPYFYFEAFDEKWKEKSGADYESHWGIWYSNGCLKLPLCPPTVTSTSPTNGSTAGGTSVTITGTGFTGATAVTFGTTPATSYTVVSDTQTTATSPAHAAGPVDVTVTTSSGTSATSAADQFTYISVKPSPSSTLVSAVVPTSRTAVVGSPVTVLMSVINAGSTTAHGVSITQASSLPVTIIYQQWNGVTFIGTPNTPVDLPTGGTANFVLAITPSSAFSTIPLTFTVAGSDTGGAAPIWPVNTLTMRATTAAAPDIIMMSTDYNVQAGVNTPTAFAIATTNVGGAAATGVSLQVVVPASIQGLQYTVDETNPATGAIIGSATGLTINPGDQPTFVVFLTPTHAIPLDLVNNRITAELVDGSGNVIGAVSVAVSTT